MISMLRFRKRYVEVEAVRWTGENLAEMTAFAGTNFRPVDPEDRIEDSETTGQVYDELHSTWIGVYDGHWVLRGIRGEFYPIDAKVFTDTYELVDTPRLNTPDIRHQDGSRTILCIKRHCNGCDALLGDSTEAEVDAAIAGVPLPDVRGECPICTPRTAESGADDSSKEDHAER
jgi:hypothetical protein